MYRSSKSQTPVCCLAAALSVVGQLASSSPPIAASEPAAEATPYHADPQHLWNRLHEAIFVRIGPDGREYGRDRLDPLLWHETEHLLQGPSNDRAVALLQEFIGDACNAVALR